MSSLPFFYFITKILQLLDLSQFLLYVLPSHCLSSLPFRWIYFTFSANWYFLRYNLLIPITFCHFYRFSLFTSSPTSLQFSFLFFPKIWQWHQTYSITHLETLIVWGHSDTQERKYNLQEKHRTWRIGLHICLRQIMLFCSIFRLSPIFFVFTFSFVCCLLPFVVRMSHLFYSE